jgi:hypothetical protein
MRVSSSWSPCMSMPARYLTSDFQLFLLCVNAGFLLLHACMSSRVDRSYHMEVSCMDMWDLWVYHKLNINWDILPAGQNVHARRYIGIGTDPQVHIDSARKLSHSCIHQTKCGCERDRSTRFEIVVYELLSVSVLVANITRVLDRSVVRSCSFTNVARRRGSHLFVSVPVASQSTRSIDQ